MNDTYHDTEWEKVRSILMKRDDLSHEEAEALMQETARMIDAALMADEDPEQVLAEQLGLEPDYIFAFI